MVDWSVPFDPSLLSSHGLAVNVPSEESAIQLAQILDEMGLTWGGSDTRLVEENWWNECGPATIWYVCEIGVYRGHTDDFDEDDVDDWPPTTFYGGTRLADFDIPDGASLF